MPGDGALAGAERTAHVVGRPIPLLKRIVRPPLSDAEATVGREFPALEYVVDEAAVRAFEALAARVLPNRRHTPSQVVPPAFFLDEPMQCINTQFSQSGRLHAGHRIEGLAPVPIGATIRSRARVTGRQERSGRLFVEVACTVSVVEGAAEIPAVAITATLVV
ncbi:MAG TPA: hypothetical protein VHD15_02065 [Hyphomicrobiales bacterium]|nr:hypothetical protein [Hyphomicrobiales bacterium]